MMIPADQITIAPFTMYFLMTQQAHTWDTVHLDGLMKNVMIIVALITSLTATAQPSEAVTAERIGELKRGAKFSEVISILGTNWQHQFSARIDNADYLCVSYHFQYPFIYHYFLFRDGQLDKICIPPPFETEIVHRNGMRIEVRKPVNPQRRVEAVMSAPAMSPQDLLSDITSKIRNKRNGENAGILPALIITSPLLVPRMLLEKPEVEREYRRNRELADRFNAQKVKLGASLADAVQVYGPAISRRRLNEEKMLVCWGVQEALLKVKPQHKYSEVCALILGERLQQVYSHDFVEGLEMNSNNDPGND